MYMKRIVIILIGLISVAYGQSSPTSAKTRFVNGLYVGTKLDSYFSAADSNAIYWRADSVVMAKYKGTARALAFAVSGGYIPYSDTTSLLSQVVRTFGTQTIGGNKTFSNDITLNSLTAGRGSGNLITNSVLGYDAFLANTTGHSSVSIGNASLYTNTIGFQNTAVGFDAMFFNLNGDGNSSLGWSSLKDNSTGNNNTAVGGSALRKSIAGSNNSALGYNAGYFTSSGASNTAPSNSTYIGYDTRSASATIDNETVIGASATGNGSNTVTIGNSSVTDNYFSGRVRAANATFTDNITVTSASNARAILVNGRSSDNFSQQLFYDNTGATRYGYIQSHSTNGGQLTLVGDGGGRVDLDNRGVVITTGNLGASSATFTSSVRSVLGYRVANNGLREILLRNTSDLDRWNVFSDGTTETGSGDVGGDFGIASYNDAGTILGTRFSIVRSNGYVSAVGVYDAAVGGTNRDVFVDNTGLIGYVSSFMASKKNIVPISNTDWLHKLNPVSFNYRIKDKKGNYTDSAYKELEYGLIAEEVEPINKEMVFYDVDSVGNKKLRGVHYSKLIIPLLAEVKEHKKRIDTQDKIIEALLTRIKALEAKLN